MVHIEHHSILPQPTADGLPGGMDSRASYAESPDPARPASDAPAFCPSAQTLLGTNTSTGQRRIIPIRCKRWTCDFCQHRNKWILMQKARAGKPTTMITLTSPRRQGETPKQCHDRLRKQIPKLIQKIRRQHGPFEAAIFLEETKSGFPHWHILARTSYIPQRWLSDEWHKLTGAFIVDIRAIDKDSRDVEYVTKYLVKQGVKPKAQRLGRLVSFTKHYYRKADKKHEKEWIWELLRHEHWKETRERLLHSFTETVDGELLTYTPKSGVMPLVTGRLPGGDCTDQPPTADETTGDWPNTS